MTVPQFLNFSQIERFKGSKGGVLFMSEEKKHPYINVNDDWAKQRTVYWDFSDELDVDYWKGC